MKDYSVIIENLMDGIITNLEEAYDYGYDQGYADGKKENCDCKDNMEAEYNRGLNDAWEAARKLELSFTEGGLDTEIISEIFDGLTYYYVLKDVPASEAIAKIREYEAKKKQDAEQKQDTEIKVGDEVTTIFGKKGVVITDVPCEDGTICVWFPNYTRVQLYPLKDLSKTGRTFPQIAEVLAEMRGEE